MAHETITTSQALSESTFPTWDTSTWLFDGTNLPSVIMSSFAPTPIVPRPDDSIMQRISFSQATTPSYWNDYDWDVQRVWSVTPGKQMPRLITRAFEGEIGDPLHHSRHLILVEPHIDGTMNFDNITWKYITTLERKPNPALVGAPGQRITYAISPLETSKLWFDPTVGREVPIQFIASGVRDPFGAGGFSNYTTEMVRSDILNNSYSTIINFYFARVSDLPKLNYKLKIQTPTQLLEANTTFQVTGPILVSTNPETFEFVSIPYVDIDDPNALPVHVSTPDGIKALTKYVESKQYELKGNDEE